MTPRIAKWTVQPDGSLDDGTINRLDDIAAEFAEVVQGEGSATDITRLTRGMGRVHLIALAIAVASLDGTELADALEMFEGWRLVDLRAAHAAYHNGDRRERTRQGERLYARRQKRQTAARAAS